jgi:hypothetical protein
VTSPLIAPPPTSATRHRKDSQAKRGSAEFAASPLAGGGAASAQHTPVKPPQPQFGTSPRAEGETLDFFEQQQPQAAAAANDFFGQQSIASTDLFGQPQQPPQPQQPQQTTIPFGDDLSFMQQQQPPAQHVAPVNVFDMLEASPARGAVAAPAAASGAGGAAAAVSYNPFGDEHEADPFAAIASRSPPKQGNVFDF